MLWAIFLWHIYVYINKLQVRPSIEFSHRNCVYNTDRIYNEYILLLLINMVSHRSSFQMDEQ